MALDLQRIPFGCYAGVIIMLLGVIAADVRGVFVGLVVAVVTVLGVRYTSRHRTRRSP